MMTNELTAAEREVLESAEGPLGMVHSPPSMSRPARKALLAALRRKGLITYIGGDAAITIKGQAAVTKRPEP
jgi:hypothetical protein